MPLRDYERTERPYGDFTYPVYRRGEGPGVVLIHELPGLSPACVALGDEIAAAGFAVYMPLMFGKPGHHAGNLGSALRLPRLCVRREFELVAQSKSSPITRWLRSLAGEVHAEHGGVGVGAIGMCLSGGFVISMLLEPSVVAPVVCQPAVPMCVFPYPTNEKQKADPGVSPEEMAEAKRRVKEEGLQVLGLRFSSDRISPPERFSTFKCALAPGFEDVEIPSGKGSPHGLPKRAHGVLTQYLGKTKKTLHPEQIKARTRVIEFLVDRLT